MQRDNVVLTDDVTAADVTGPLAACTADCARLSVQRRKMMSYTDTFIRIGRTVAECQPG